MCDEKLDTVPEGLTARVSALEEKIALLQSGAVQIPQSAPVNKTAPAPAASNTAGETVMYKKSVEAPKVEAVKEPVKSGQKNVREGLKPVGWWIEAAKKIGEKDQSIAPFMKLEIPPIFSSIVSTIMPDQSRVTSWLGPEAVPCMV
jgi:hypothetical protein